jgi:hypothetical protein
MEMQQILEMLTNIKANQTKADTSMKAMLEKMDATYEKMLAVFRADGG